MKQKLLILFACLLGSLSAAAAIDPVKPSGTGEAADPYQIGTAEELVWFAGLVNGTLTDGTAQNSAACAILTADIDLNPGFTYNKSEKEWYLKGENGVIGEVGTPENIWTPIGKEFSITYTGSFNGNYHKVSGLYINGSETFGGFFGQTGANVNIKNLQVSGEINSSASYNAGIVAYIVGKDFSISNCFNEVNITSSSGFAGGIVCGISTKAKSGTISECINNGDLSGDSSVGGIIARNNSSTNDYTITVSKCVNYGSLTANATIKKELGGVIGFTSGKTSISDCANYYPIFVTTSDKPYIGGLIGIINNTTYKATITNCFTYSNILAGCNESSALNETNVYFCTNENESYTKKGTPVSQEQLSSGEICYKLNGSKDPSDGGTVWRQNLQETDDGQHYLTNDNYPVLSCVFTDGDNNVLGIVNPGDDNQMGHSKVTKSGSTYSNVHSYDETKWNYDATNHWHDCTGCDERKDITTHTMENGVCTDCGYHAHAHAIDASWTTDETGHWKTCNVVEGCEGKLEYAKHTLETQTVGNQEIAVCTVCGYHSTHVFKTSEWAYDGENHWHPAELEGCDERTDEVKHSIGTDGKCTVCGFVNTAEEMALNDGEGYTNTAAMVVGTLTYTRTFTKDCWQALFLPFSLTEDEWSAVGTVAKLKNVTYNDSEITLNWETISGATEAGKPYIIKPNSKGVTLEINGEKTLVPNTTNSETTFDRVTIGGTYAVKDMSAVPSKGSNFCYWGLYNGNFYSTNDANKTLKPYRIYLIAPALTSPSSAPIRNSIGGSDATEIEGLIIEQVQNDDCMYNLSGQKVGEDYKGLVIKNGKKFIRK